MKKKILSTILTIMLLVVSFSHQVYAEETDMEMSAVEQLNSMVKFDGTFETIEFIPANVSNARGITTRKSITIPLVGMSSFLNFDEEEYGITEENYYEFVSEKIKYSSSNSNVVAAYDGRILARGVGNATVTVQYEDMVQYIDITVADEVSEELVREALSSQNSTMRLATTEDDERRAIVEKGSDMIYLRWTPTKDVTGWKGQITYKANVKQIGMPYTQSYLGQRDDVAFMEELNNSSDFYTTQVDSNGVKMPRYGNDCSAFVAICWGGLQYDGNGRINTGKLYDNYSSLGGFENLEVGDAVVSRQRSHTFLCVQNWETPPSGSQYDTSYITCYEQTPYNAQLTFWTYDKLEEQGYKPISKF